MNFDKYIKSVLKTINEDRQAFGDGSFGGIEGSDHIEHYANLVDSAAQKVFCMLWADWVEENASMSKQYQNLLRGGDIFDIAPNYEEFFKSRREKTAFENKIYTMFARFEEANGRDLMDLYNIAMEADGQDPKNPKEFSTPEWFAYYTLAQMMGHGVGWADDHKTPGFKYPHAEVSTLEYPKTFPDTELQDHFDPNKGQAEDWEKEGEGWKGEGYEPDDNTGDEWKNS